MNDRINVNVLDKYDVILESGALYKCGGYIREKTNATKAVIITDDIVAKLYIDTVIKSVEDEGMKVSVFIFKNGETSKNHDTLTDIYEFLADSGITRKDIVIALGGGVVGDTAGFAAATYLRGVNFVQIPTTFLAQIDSSVGGKTGVNINNGKNLVGAFWQPIVVICDFDTLNTLPEEILNDSVSEAIKYGLIADKDLFYDLLTKDFNEIYKGIVTRCVEIKARIVGNDEHESGERMLLNFGHTLGHAIERCSGYSISHGKAVGMGIELISKAQFENGSISKNDYNDILTALNKFNLNCKSGFTIDELLSASMTDKKRVYDDINIVLLRKIGQAYVKRMTIDEFNSFMRGD